MINSNTIKITNIIWDTEDNVSLPSEFEVDGDMSIEDIIEFLAIETGYCVQSFNVPLLKKDEMIIEKMWSYVCNGNLKKVKEYYAQGWNVNIRYNAFNEQHSLIAGAYRNNKFDMVDYLISVGETPCEKELPEVFRLTSKMLDYHLLLNNLTLKQMWAVEKTLVLFERDVLFIIDIGDGLAVVNCKTKSRATPLQEEIVLWYNEILEHDDISESVAMAELIEYIRAEEE